MEDLITKTAEKLRIDGDRIGKFFSDLTIDQLETILYETDLDVWMVKDILAHFIFAEKGFIELFNNILDNGNGAANDFDIDEYNRDKMKAYKTNKINELVIEFLATRKATLDFIGGLTEKDLKMIGRHPALGITSLHEMIKMIYLHNQIHLRDVKKILD